MSEFNFSLLDRIGQGQLNRTQSTPKPSEMAGELVDKSGGKSFSETLQSMFYDVNQAQLDADKATQSFVAGEQIQLHEVMLAVEKADIAIKTATAFRNKIVEAYQEIMRMPV
jgi:flagellar hook-basal body complex protein FliE